MFGNKKQSFKSRAVEALREIKPELVLHDEDHYVTSYIAQLARYVKEISRLLDCDPLAVTAYVRALKAEKREPDTLLGHLRRSEKEVDKLNAELRESKKELRKAREACENKRKELRRLNIYDDKEIEREYLKRKHLKPGATFKINNVNMVIDCLEYNERDGEAVYFFDTRNDDLITSKMSVDAVLGIMGVYDE